MPLSGRFLGVEKYAGQIRRALHFAFYDWTREMPRSKRFITWAGILIQGYAIFSGFARTLAWPWMWPRGLYLYAGVLLLYSLGYIFTNAMLTSEFSRKTLLESDQIAARQIQQTLIPQKLQEIPGYEMAMYYKPYREVGGDYFDAIDLPRQQTLLILADVSGKGVAAALLSANIQALVRSIASVEVDPLIFASRINQHLCRYAPQDRFATAVFLVLDHASGELTYVNAGHNAPVIYSAEPATMLEATGLPLGLFPEAQYQTGRALVPWDGALLLFTDGLTDSIAGIDSEALLLNALVGDAATTMSNLKSLIDPGFNEDDVTILLVKREAAPFLREELQRERTV